MNSKFKYENIITICIDKLNFFNFYNDSQFQKHSQLIN